MRFSQADWERERSGWRTVVQLNIVRSINTILRVIQAEMNGDVPADSEDDQATMNDANEIEVIKFTDRHQLLMIRLAPLNSVEVELKRRLGSGSEPVQPALPMSATPFDTPDAENNFRRKPEFSVRSWRDLLEQEARTSDGSGASKSLDSVTTSISGCKEDMKALWNDQAVRLALKRHKLQLGDTAGL